MQVSRVRNNHVIFRNTSPIPWRFNIFIDITMYETLVRPHEVNQIPDLSPITEVTERLKKAERRREEKRQRQIANSRLNHQIKRKRTDQPDGEAGRSKEEAGNKRARTDDEDDPDTRSSLERIPSTNDKQQAEIKETFSVKVDEEGNTSDTETRAKLNVSKAMPEVRGHTSYLTFACLIPSAPSSSEDMMQGVDN